MHTFGTKSATVYANEPHCKKTSNSQTTTYIATYSQKLLPSSEMVVTEVHFKGESFQIYLPYCVLVNKVIIHSATISKSQSYLCFVIQSLFYFATWIIALS